MNDITFIPDQVIALKNWLSDPRNHCYQDIALQYCDKCKVYTPIIAHEH